MAISAGAQHATKSAVISSEFFPVFLVLGFVFFLLLGIFTVEAMKEERHFFVKFNKNDEIEKWLSRTCFILSFCFLVLFVLSRVKI